MTKSVSGIDCGLSINEESSEHRVSKTVKLVFIITLSNFHQLW